MTCLPTRCPGRRAPELEGPVAFVPGRSGLIGFLLASTVPLWFCAGLVGLAVAPSLGAPVPRWLILAYGVGCVLLALLALLVSQPRAQGALEQLVPGAVALFPPVQGPCRTIESSLIVAPSPPSHCGGHGPPPLPTGARSRGREFFSHFCV
jgi:hypothetical protein